MHKELPEAFCTRIETQYPGESDKLLDAISNEPNVSLRVNVAKKSVEELGIPIERQVPWCFDGYYLKERPNYTLEPLFHAGVIYPQESSSMFISHVLRSIEQDMPQNPVVLDLCASPGGKSIIVSSWLNGRGYLVSNEVIRQRAWILRENIAKWGGVNSIVTNLMPDDLCKRTGLNVDLMLVDAPCSGEGMFRKDDVAIKEWTPARAQECADRQREILEQAWPMLKAGGYMIYSTCTFNPAENEENVSWLLDNYDAEVVPVNYSEEWGITAKEHSGMAFLPHKVDGEGLFVCLIRKTSGRVCKAPKTKVSSKKYTISEQIQSMIPGKEVYLVNENRLVALPSDTQIAKEMALLAINSDALWCGIPVGEVIKNNIVLADELPLSQGFNVEASTKIAVKKQAALEFLHGDVFDTEGLELTSGRAAVMYDGIPLGFVNVISKGNTVRLNNCYPKEWRIRMRVDL
ncbi:MAG: rRNA cytosine-C5-methyltransferase [Bacteroidales bacterium]|nr:rRNA cytosine-C5-methyltransferase [Bacteroidales bacterium]